jgi:hypothetical protein
MHAAGLLREDVHADTLALSTFARRHGGLTLTQMTESIEPLEAALDGALAGLRAAATPPAGSTTRLPSEN